MKGSVKKQVRSLLAEGKFDRLLELYEEDRRARNALRLRLYDADEAVRSAAVEAMAKIMGRLWKKGEHGKVVEYLRSQIWTITEESGGIGWSAPETVARIIANIPELMDPHGRVMISRALEEAPLVQNGLRAIGRLGRIASSTLDLFREEIAGIFESEDIVTLALAAW
ncbi:MAG: DVU0298 family protein, partial [Pseudomonadota bacterium]